MKDCPDCKGASKHECTHCGTMGYVEIADPYTGGRRALECSVCHDRACRTCGEDRQRLEEIIQDFPARQTE